MSVGTLWTTSYQATGLRIRAVAAYGGLEITLGEGYEHGTTNKTPEYKAKFASGKIPAFETPSGLTLFESTAIARYLASLAKNSTLLGSSQEDQALIDQWVSFVDHEVAAPMRVLSLLLHNAFPYNRPADLWFRERTIQHLHVLEDHLQKNTFFVGERITLADISVASVLKRAFEFIIDAELCVKYPNCVRFYNTVTNNPKIKAVWGETAWAEKAAQFTPPAKQAKPAKPPKEDIPPTPKPVKQAKEEDDDDDDEPALKEEPKPKNPLDLLPKSNFNLEDWKRAYSNLDTRGPGGSLDWLDQHFDKEGFSIWRVDYKYNEELTLVFMSSNLISGFFNRLEASRKYLFGSMGVLGQNNNSRIAGAFIARGQDFKPVFEVAPDWESYDFKRIDLGNEEDKAFFEAALAWDLELDGKKWADGRNFK